MLWSNAARRLAFATALFATAGSLAACSSFRPVYGGALAAQSSLALRYEEPNSRLEQIIYQDLRLRLGSSDAPTAASARVSIVRIAGSPAMSATANPSKPLDVTITATLTVTPADGGAPVIIVRMATAAYTRSGQVLADRAAATEAEERAARAVAESLRLAVLADLSRQ
jgi:hypothetical protein